MKYYLLILIFSVIGLSNAGENEKAIKDGVKNLAPMANVTSIEKTPINGVSEIMIDTGRGGEIYYISNDGKYLMNGSMYNTTSREDLTENKKAVIRKDLLAKFEKQDKINFFPDEMKHHVTVYTDIDCGYCRKLHNQMEEYNTLGIGVSYLFFPRAGSNSPSFDKAVTVWCSDDQQEAMTNAKSGINLEPKKCDNPIQVQYDSGKSAGVTGTPAIVLDNGKMLPGYLPPETLLQRLEMLSAQ